MALRDALPDRPLTMAEADTLVDDSDGERKFWPSSYLEGPDVVGVTSLLIAFPQKETATLIGYQPESDAWETIHDWDSPEQAHDEFEEIATDWATSTYDNDDVIHSFIDTGDSTNDNSELPAND